MAQLTKNQMQPEKRYHFLPSAMPLHVVRFILFQLLAPKTAL